MIYLVAEGHAQRVSYTPPSFGPGTSPPAEGTVAGFSGFRVRAPLNRAEDFDEFAVFQGASYFRAVARGQEYGLSARGLALNTAQARGKSFRSFAPSGSNAPTPRPASWWSMRSWTAPAPLGPIAGPYVRAIRRSWMSN